MTGQTCAVASCKSKRLTLKKEGGRNYVSFHSFPKANDLVSSTIRKEWINRCKRYNKFNVNTSTICSLHFTPNDFERDLQNELLGLPLRRILKKNAVPTLNLNVRCGNPNEDTPPAKRVKKEKNKNRMESLDTNTCLSNTKTSHLLNSTTTAVPSSGTEISDKPSIPSTSDTYKQKYEDLLIKYNQLKSNSNKKMKVLNRAKSIRK